MGWTRRVVLNHGGVTVAMVMGSLAGCSGGGDEDGGGNEDNRVGGIHVGEYVYATRYGDWKSQSQDPKLYALDSDSGRIAWRFEAAGGLESPVVKDGTLYVTEWRRNEGGFEGTVYAIAADTGERIWATPVTGRPFQCPTISDGRVYVGAGRYGLHVLDAVSGENLWSTEVGRGAYTDSPTVQNDAIYLGGRSAMYALDANSHEIKWRKPTPFPPTEAQLFDGILYFGGDSNEAWALDTRTQETIWKFVSDYGKDASGGVRILDGTAYAVFWNAPLTKSSLYALDPESGEKRWRYQADSLLRIEENPRLVDGVVYIAEETGTVHRIDGATGSERSSFAVEPGAIFLMEVADGSVYLGNEAGTVFAYDAETGDHKWTSSLVGDGGILDL